jgi:hypothetical protein
MRPRVRYCCFRRWHRGGRRGDGSPKDEGVMQEGANFMLIETSDEEFPALVIGRDGEGRVAISVMSGDGEGAMIVLSGEQVAALRIALSEV